MFSVPCAQHCFYLMFSHETGTSRAAVTVKLAKKLLAYDFSPATAIELRNIGMCVCVYYVYINFISGRNENVQDARSRSGERK